jgi:hypothetical protein
LKIIQFPFLREVLQGVTAHEHIIEPSRSSLDNHGKVRFMVAFIAARAVAELLRRAVESTCEILLPEFDGKGPRAMKPPHRTVLRRRKMHKRMDARFLRKSRWELVWEFFRRIVHQFFTEGYIISPIFVKILFLFFRLAEFSDPFLFPERTLKFFDQSLTERYVISFPRCFSNSICSINSLPNGTNFPDCFQGFIFPFSDAFLFPERTSGVHRDPAAGSS